MEPFSQAVAIVGGKGGVGKSTWAAELAATAAAGHGWRVLLIEADPQGNQWRQFGLSKSDGQPMLDALLNGDPLPRQQGRADLDVALCGEAMFDFVLELYKQQIVSTITNDTAPITPAEAWHRALAPIANEYQLIVFDTPPGEKHLVESVLAVCSGVVGATTPYDEAAIDGLEIVYDRMDGCGNDHIALLGVGLFGVSKIKGHEFFESNAREALNIMLNGDAPVFESTIRLNLTAASDHRSRSLLAGELEREAQAAKKRRLAALRQRRKARKTGETIDLTDAAAPRTSAKIAAELATDHHNLSTEVLEALTAHIQGVHA